MTSYHGYGRVLSVIWAIIVSVFSQPAWAFESLEVMSQQIEIHQSGYFNTAKNLTPEQAMQAVKAGNLNALPKASYVVGFDSQTYWFAFDLSNRDSERQFIDVRSTVTDQADLFVFVDGQLIRQERSGYALYPSERPVKGVFVRFALEDHQRAVYLLAVTSANPIYPVFAFGSEHQLNDHWYQLYAISLMTLGVFVALVLYNLFLFFIVKSMDYLYYVVYMTALLLFDGSALGIQTAFYHQILDFTDAEFFFVLVKSIELFALVFFTIHFLELKTREPKLYKALIYLLIFTLASGIIYLVSDVKLIAVFLVSVLLYTLLYAGIKTYHQGYQPAKYYLLATGGTLVISNFFFMMPFGLIPLDFFTLNIPNFVIVWDLIVLSFALAYRIRLLQEESEQKKVIEETHHHTMSSIKYASIIQGALVPKPAIFDRAFQDYFCLWLPKDMVGGDIYSITPLRNDDEFLLLAVDCTGHGVPGALLTMLVKAVEQQIVSELLTLNTQISPAHILTRFNEKIHFDLTHQDTSIGHIGFDGAVVYYNRREQRLRYAGANMPLFYLDHACEPLEREMSSETNAHLRVLKGSRRSIGYHQVDHQNCFVDHEIQVSQGMRFYLSSDGYIDQIGGGKQIPLGKKRFLAYLNAHCRKSFSEQQKLLVKLLQDYAGTASQTDDIMVIGFQI